MDGNPVVRNALKNALARRDFARTRLYAAAIIAALITLVAGGIGGYMLISAAQPEGSRPITLAQADALSAQVAQVARSQGRSPTSVWATLKRDLGVYRRADMTQAQYDQAVAILATQPSRE